MPPSEQDVGVRGHVDRVRHDRHANRIFQCGLERAVGQRRIVVGMNDVVADTRMLGHLGEKLFQHAAGLELIGVALVQRIGGREKRERIEDLRVAIVGIAGRKLLHPGRIGGGALRVIELVGIAVERSQRFDVVGFALGFLRDGARLLDRGEPLFQIVGPRRRPNLVPQAHCNSPITHRALGIGFADRRELLEGLSVPE